MGVLFQDRATIMEAIANSGDINITGNRRGSKSLENSHTDLKLIILTLQMQMLFIPLIFIFSQMIIS